MRTIKVLFILRKRGDYYQPDAGDAFTEEHKPWLGAAPYSKGPALAADQMIGGAKSVGWGRTNWTGLRHSVAYVADMLNNIGVEADFVRVQDDNGIDAVVTKYRPTHVILEALWVQPAKLAVLAAKYSGTRWNVRLHSELPFMALESMMTTWLVGYVAIGPTVTISTNSKRAQNDLSFLGVPILYMPNYYPLYPPVPRPGLPADAAVDVGCFGAIRPLKNILSQAVAAIAFATQVKRPLRFHVNADRIEMGGAPVLKNLIGLFTARGAVNATLVQHPWLDQGMFAALCRMMDIGMQVSFSETFNIVSADLTQAAVPTVVSPEVSWANKLLQADPTSVPDITARLLAAFHGGPALARLNYDGLEAYDVASEMAWPVALTAMN